MSENRQPARGFITVATGGAKYYMMAHTLLLSYRLASADPLPFAILCDRENRWTRDFDDVVILEKPARSYMDKLELLVHSPYDETIFIDSDCIAFRDLNRLWDSFQNATDFSSVGWVHPLDSTEGWFTREGAGKYADQLEYLHFFHGGIYYIRKGETCERVYELAKDVAAHYYEFKFRLFKNPADETVLSLASALCGCKPILWEEWMISLIGGTTYTKLDFFQRELTYLSKRRSAGPNPPAIDGILLHFGSGQYDSPQYLLESRKVMFEHRRGRHWNAAERALNLAFCQVLYVVIRNCRKVGRPVKNWIKRRKKARRAR